MRSRRQLPRELLLLLLGYLLLCSADVRSIPRYQYGNLSFRDFYALGPHRDRPMVLFGAPARESPCFGALQRDSRALLALLLEHCGGGIRLDEMAGKEQRAGKQSFTTLEFKDFLRRWVSDDGMREINAQHGPVIGLEYPIMERCAQELWEKLVIPPYFSGDAGLRAKAAEKRFGENSGYPALTFTQPGFLTASHVDWPNNEIWIGMCFGRKRIRTISVSDLATHWNAGARLSRFGSGKLSEDGRLLLNPHFHHSFDLFDDDFVAAELKGVPIYDSTLSGGDILYLPTSVLHCVVSEEKTLYVISDYVDMNALLAPNPFQLPLKLDSCAQRCHLANFTSEYGGPTICRKAPGCNDLVGWLLDDAVRFPLVDGSGPVKDAGRRPRGSPSIEQVAASGAERLLRRKLSAWRAPWQGR